MTITLGILTFCSLFQKIVYIKYVVLGQGAC